MFHVAHHADDGHPLWRPCVARPAEVTEFHRFQKPSQDLVALIAHHEQAEIQKALQLDLPAVAGEPIPFLYV
jgi:hypothetical protein